MGRAGQKEKKIIENPENYEEIKKKYLEREEEQLKQILARRNAESENELKDIANKAIVTRALRAASDHKQLKDRSIIREAQSRDVQDLKNKLNEEINAIGQRILNEMPELASTQDKEALRGRVSQTVHTNIIEEK